MLKSKLIRSPGFADKIDKFLSTISRENLVSVSQGLTDNELTALIIYDDGTEKNDTESPPLDINNGRM